LLIAFDGVEPSPLLRERLAALAVHAILLPDRRGPGAARNAAAREASGEWLAFTEDDCEPAADWLERAAARIGANPSIDVLEGETVTPAGSPVRRRDRTFLNYLPTNLFVRRALFDRVGGYCEDFFDTRRGIYFREDSDLGFTLEGAGAGVAFEPGARVVHPVEHPRFLDPLRWALRCQMDALLERRHPARFRARIEIVRWGPFSLRRPFVRACAGYVIALASAAAAGWLGEPRVALGCIAGAGLMLIPVWAKWGLAPARLPLVPIIPFVVLAALARGYWMGRPGR